MRRKDRPPTRHRPAAAQQLEFFAPLRRRHSCRELAWETLPEDTREELIKLMTRLLLDHGPGNRRPDAAGGDRDV